MSFKDWFEDNVRIIFIVSFFCALLVFGFLSCSNIEESVKGCKDFIVGLKDESGKAVCGVDVEGRIGCSEVLKVNTRYTPVFGCVKLE